MGTDKASQFHWSQFKSGFFLGRALSPVGIDDSELMAVILIDNVCASLKRLSAVKRQDLMYVITSSTETTLMHLRLLFAPLFSIWIKWIVFLPLLAQANIKCLEKTAVSTRPLNHRSIALLDSDYKLFTTILSIRVRPLLSVSVLPSQVGFVRYHSIHTALDVFSAVKKPPLLMTSSVIRLYCYLTLQKLMIPTESVLALVSGVDGISSQSCLRGGSIASQHYMQFHCERISPQASTCELSNLTRLFTCSTVVYTGSR